MVSKKGFIIDVDGTLCHGNRVIPGTPEYIQKLRSNNIPFMIASNNSSMSSEQYLQKLINLGFDVTAKDVLTATKVTAEYLKKYCPGKRIYAMGLEGFLKELKDNGVNLVEEDPDIVLLAYDKTITFDKFNKATHFINHGAKYMATHPDVVCNSEDGYDVDIGALMLVLNASTKQTPEIIAKPNFMMADMLEEIMGIKKKDLYVVGDRLYTDIEFAKKNGMIGVLILTGENTAEEAAVYPYKPDYIINTIEDLDQFM